ncbi:response regulator transcription factor [Streptomyces filipinensis]|uniref:response regulator transcription factor n=1 Tax=Streptomyces filipinensis TaxID=66887 RepID=UPI0036E2E458
MIGESHHVQGKLLAGGAAGEDAITVQPAPADLLLPALAAWYGITRRERGVLELALEGLPAQQIARRLHLSPHTVNDHFKAIYRKTGVACREGLISGLRR